MKLLESLFFHACSFSLNIARTFRYSQIEHWDSCSLHHRWVSSFCSCSKLLFSCQRRRYKSCSKIDGMRIVWRVWMNLSKHFHGLQRRSDWSWFQTSNISNCVSSVFCKNWCFTKISDFSIKIRLPFLFFLNWGFGFSITLIVIIWVVWWLLIISLGRRIWRRIWRLLRLLVLWSYQRSSFSTITANLYHWGPSCWNHNYRNNQRE